jgi:head-tail adaptor
MARRPQAGQLNCKIQFQRRAEGATDAYGNPVPGDWENVGNPFSARLQPLFGSRLTVEDVGAARLSSKQPYNLTVRNCAATRAVRTDWRVVDVRVAQDQNGATPRVWNIKTIVDPDERGAFWEMLVVEGEAS